MGDQDSGVGVVANVFDQEIVGLVVHFFFNHLRPSITIQILLTGLHTFHWVVIGKTC